MHQVRNYIEGRMPYFLDRKNAVAIRQVVVVSGSQQVTSRSVLHLEDHSQITRSTRLKTLVQQLGRFARIEPLK